jgi:hypothetical protein
MALRSRGSPVLRAERGGKAITNGFGLPCTMGSANCSRAFPSWPVHCAKSWTHRNCRRPMRRLRSFRSPDERFRKRKLSCRNTGQGQGRNFSLAGIIQMKPRMDTDEHRLGKAGERFANSGVAAPFGVHGWTQGMVRLSVSIRGFIRSELNRSGLDREIQSGADSGRANATRLPPAGRPDFPPPAEMTTNWRPLIM